MADCAQGGSNRKRPPQRAAAAAAAAATSSAAAHAAASSGRAAPAAPRSGSKKPSRSYKLKKKEGYFSWYEFAGTSGPTGYRSMRAIVLDVANAIKESRKTGAPLDLRFLADPRCLNPSVLFPLAYTALSRTPAFGGGAFERELIWFSLGFYVR
jgi:hypothetical protein